MQSILYHYYHFRVFAVQPTIPSPLLMINMPQLQTLQKSFDIRKMGTIALGASLRFNCQIELASLPQKDEIITYLRN